MEMHTDVLLVTANVGSLFDNVSLLCLNPLLFSSRNMRSVNELGRELFRLSLFHNRFSCN